MKRLAHGQDCGISRRTFVKGLSLGAALGLSGLPLFPAAAFAQQSGQMHPTPVRWYKPGPNGSVFCGICPHNCHLAKGKTGLCRTHVNRDGALFTTAWANPCILQPDPVEEAPLFHVAVQPGTKAVYVAAGGCAVLRTAPSASP